VPPAALNRGGRPVADLTSDLRTKHLATLRRWADDRDGGLGSACAWALEELERLETQLDAELKWRRDNDND